VNQMVEVVQKGDFVKVNYTGRSVAGKTFDTTREEVAKNEGLFQQGMVFKPVLVVAGEGHLLLGLDEALVGAEVGVQKTVRMPKEKAFGDRKPELEKLLPLKEFSQRGINPTVGMVLDFDGSPGRVTGVEAGRVKVDFNPELAGQELEYDVLVEKRFAVPEEQVKALQQEFLPQAEASLNNGVVKLAVPKEAPKGEGFLRAKMRFLYFALRFVKGAQEVLVEERYPKPGEGQQNV